MHFVVLGLIALAILFGPQLWARRVLSRYSRPRHDFPGSGGQLARHLLDRMGMEAVKVEATQMGDHYDPVAKAVRLSPQNLDGSSLTAVVVAAHEVGHALQDHLGYAPLRWRTRLVKLASVAEKTGSGVMMVMPLVAAVTRSPSVGAAMFGVGLVTMAGATLVHLVTLPVEWDASFKRALPLLNAGKYLNVDDQKAARKILRACALTYAAASLASLLNVWRWLRLWRR